MKCSSCGSVLPSGAAACPACSGSPATSFLERSGEVKKTLLETTARIPARPPQPDLEKTAMLDRTATIGRPAADPDAMGTTTRTLTGRGKGSVELVRAWLDDQKHYGDLLELETVLCLPEGQAIEETRLRLKEKQKMARIWAEAQKADLQTLGRSALDKLRNLEEELSAILEKGLPALVSDLRTKQLQFSLRSFEAQARALVTGKVLKAHALMTLREMASKADLTEADVAPLLQRLEEEGVAVGLPFAGQRLASRQEFIAACRADPAALETVFADEARVYDLSLRLQDCLDVSGAKRSVEQLRSSFPADPAMAACALLWRLGDRSLPLSSGVADDLASWVRGVHQGVFTGPSVEALRSGRLSLWLREGLQQPVLQADADEAAQRHSQGEDGEEALWHVAFRAEEALGPQDLDPQTARDAIARLVSKKPGFTEAVYRLGVAESSLGRTEAALKLLRRLAESDSGVIGRLREQARTTRNEDLRRSLHALLIPLEQEAQVRTTSPVPRTQPPALPAKTNSRAVAIASALGATALGVIITIFVFSSKGSRELPAQGTPSSVAQGMPSAVPAQRVDATPVAETSQGPTQAQRDEERRKQQEAKEAEEAVAARRNLDARTAVASETQKIEELVAAGSFEAAGEKIDAARMRAAALPGGALDELQKLTDLERRVRKAVVEKELEAGRRRLHEEELKGRIAEIEKLIETGKLPEAQDRANGLIGRQDIPDETRAVAQTLLDRVNEEWKKRFETAQVTATTKKKNESTKPK